MIFESYYDQEYSLRRLSPPEYILDPRFRVHLLAAYDLEWAAPKIILPTAIPQFLAGYPAEETMVVSHNALFDASILSWRYGYVPARLQDTLGLARALLSLDKYNLGAVAEALFGYNAKGDVIHRVKGMGIQQIMNAGLWPEYQTYAMNDARLCMQIYTKLYPDFPPEERKIMDLVLRCAVQPVLHADVSLLEQHLTNLRRHKADLLERCGYDRAALMSTQQFQQALEDLGVIVEMKDGAKSKIPAFAKTDAFMETLESYDQSDDEAINFKVQALAAARLCHKSTIEETRAERFVNIAKLPWAGDKPLMPVPLRYGGASTHRLSGEWGSNFQNLPRDKTKSKLRAALCAPPGHKLIVGDLSQIEARCVAILCDQRNLIDAFRNGEDVYASFASALFNRPITKQSDPDARQVGKVAVLGCGYGVGWRRFEKMLLSSARQYGFTLPAKTADLAVAAVETYRTLYSKIPETWSLMDRLLQTTINNKLANYSEDWAGCMFESGRIVLPNKMTLRYTIGDPSVYGARVFENCCQALARIVIMQAAVRLAKKGLRFILQGHDELLFSVPYAKVEAAKQTILDEMTRSPQWMPELPLAVEIGVGMNYADVK